MHLVIKGVQGLGDDPHVATQDDIELVVGLVVLLHNHGALAVELVLQLLEQLEG